MSKPASFFFILCILFITSCNNAAQKQFEFFYYPERNVYYDVTGSLYYYSLDGGTTWDSLKAQTNREPATLGSKQIIYSTASQIWKDNSAHVNQYGGKIFSLASSDSSNLQTDLASDRKIKKVKAPVTNENKTTEKKPGFFKRLFGKKNK